MRHEKNPHILPSIPVHISFEDLTLRLSAAKRSGTLLKEAREIFDVSSHIGRPRAVLFWLNVDDCGNDRTSLSAPCLGKTMQISMGYSSRFLAPAKMAAAGVCTIGSEIETSARAAASAKQYLRSYLYEIMGTVLLEKTTDHLNGIIEQEAEARGWRVGPFLSPGSVHGWDLTDQATLCRFLPLDEINLACGNDGVIRPFNSLSFVIGIGPDYSSTTVGSPCTVCKNRETCDESMKQDRP
jgi:hypothetical protein